MKIFSIEPMGFAANSYLLTADGVHAVAIDPAQPRIAEEAERLGLEVSFCLLTHGHFDHIGGCAALQARGAKVGCLVSERALVLSNDNMGCDFGYDVPPFCIDFTFSDGEELSLAGIGLRVLATAGHTAGSCCFLAQDAIFTGDTLFCRDVGRTDLPTGSGAALKMSLKKLAALENRAVYPGHGVPTTLDEERKYGYLRL